MFSSKFSTGVLKHPGYNIGGGIGEAALFGAAYGGGKALITGEDPIEGAALGAITGGAMNAATSAILSPGTEALPEITAEAVKDTATSVPALEIAAQNAQNLGLSNLGGITTAQGIGIPSGLTSAAQGVTDAAQLGGITTAQGLGTAPIQGLTNAAQNAQNLGGITTAQGVGGGAPGGWTTGMPAQGAGGGWSDAMQNTVAPIVNQSGTGASQAGLEWYNKPGFDIRKALDIKPESMTGKVLQWTKDNPIMAGAGLGAGYGMLTQEQPTVPETEKYKSKFAGYDKDKFTPYIPEPEIYRPTYAQGGIAALAQGGVGGNTMYPQGLQDKTQYATPTQMPTSAQVVNADYEMPTNTYTGEPLKMADGGIAGYNLGGYAAGGNPRLLKGPGDGMSDNIPATIGNKQPARLADGEFVVPADVVSHLGNGSTDAGAKHLYSMMDKVRKARTGTKKQGKQIKADKYLPT